MHPQPPSSPAGRAAGPAGPQDGPAASQDGPGTPEHGPETPEHGPEPGLDLADASRRTGGGRRLAGARLRQAILGGDMAPGQRLVEEELAGTLGVTRASLRAALFDLGADGLVERIPNRGARVRAVTLDEA